MDCYHDRLQLHRRLLERQMPMVPKLSLPVCDVRDVAAAHFAAMTSSKAPGKSVKQFFRRINKWLLSRHLDVLMTVPWIINFRILTLQTRTACGFSIIFHSRQAILFCKSQSLKLPPFLNMRNSSFVIVLVNMICFAKTFQLPTSFKYCIILIQYRWNNIEEANFTRCLLKIPLNKQVTSFSKPKWRQVLFPMF